MFEVLVCVASLCVLVVSLLLFWSAIKIWREDKKHIQIIDCCSAEEAVFLSAMKAIETGKSSVAEFDAMSGKLEIKTIE